MNLRLNGTDTTGSQPPLLNKTSDKELDFIPFFFGGNVSTPDGSNGNDTSEQASAVSSSDKPFTAVIVRPDGSVDLNAWFIISIVLASLFFLLIVGMILSSYLKKRRRAKKLNSQMGSSRPLWAGRGRPYDRIMNPEGRESSPVWDVEKAELPSHDDHDDSELLPYPGDSQKYEEPRYQGGGL